MSSIYPNILPIDSINNLFCLKGRLWRIRLHNHTINISHFPELYAHSHILVSQLLHCNTVSSNPWLGQNQFMSRHCVSQVKWCNWGLDLVLQILWADQFFEGLNWRYWVVESVRCQDQLVNVPSWVHDSGWVSVRRVEENFFECENWQSVGFDSQHFRDSGEDSVVQLNTVETDFDNSTVGTFERSDLLEHDIGNSHSGIDICSNQVSFVRFQASKQEGCDDIDASQGADDGTSFIVDESSFDVLLKDHFLSDFILLGTGFHGGVVDEARLWGGDLHFDPVGLEGFGA